MPQVSTEYESLKQFRQTLAENVQNQFRQSLTHVAQAEQLINHPGTQAELNRIVNELTLRPHPKTQNLTKALADKLTEAIDPRLRFLALRLTRDQIQTQLDQDLDNNPKAKEGFKLVEAIEKEGRTTNRINETLAESTLTDQFGRPRLRVDKSIEDDLNAAILTRQSITDKGARDLVDNVVARHPQVPLSIDERNNLAQQVVVISTAYDQNTTIADFRAQYASDPKTTLPPNTTVSEYITESYESNSQHQPSVQLDPKTIGRIMEAINNPEIVNDPAFFQDLMSFPRIQLTSFTPAEFTPTISTDPTTSFSMGELGSNASSIFQSLGSNVQVGGRGLFDRVLSRFAGGSTAGSGGGLGGLLGKIFPGLGGSTAAGGAAAGTAGVAAGTAGATAGTAAAGTAVAAGGATIAGGGWIILAIIGIILIVALLFFFMSPSSPQSIARSQTDAISGAGGGGDGSTEPYDGPLIVIDINGKICWPVTGTFFGYMPENHPSVSSNQSAIDIDNVVGSPIIAPLGGTIIFAGWTTSGYGNLVKLLVDLPIAGGGTQSCTMYFGHMSQITLPNGTTSVAAGTQIGLMGNTGNSTGPHLHWGLTCPGGKPNIRDLFPPVDRNVQYGDSTSVQCSQK